MLDSAAACIHIRKFDDSDSDYLRPTNAGSNFTPKFSAQYRQNWSGLLCIFFVQNVFQHSIDISDDEAGEKAISELLQPRVGRNYLFISEIAEIHLAGFQGIAFESCQVADLTEMPFLDEVGCLGSQTAWLGAQTAEGLMGFHSEAVFYIPVTTFLVKPYIAANCGGNKNSAV